jgi:hypothetical protein
MTKKIFSFLLILLLCFSTAACANISTPKKEIPPQLELKHDFKYYSEHFQNIFSIVNELSKDYKRYLTGEEAQSLVDEVSFNIIGYLKENHLFFLQKPKVQLFKFMKDDDTAFILRIQIKILDEDTSVNSLPLPLTIDKTFLIFISSKHRGVGI